MDGAGNATTSKTTTTDDVPFVPVAVMVYGAEAVIAVGVPEITPVDVFMDSPLGRAGLTAYDDIEPAFAAFTGVRDGIGIPLNKLIGPGYAGYDISGVGGVTLTATVLISVMVRVIS